MSDGDFTSNRDIAWHRERLMAELDGALDTLERLVDHLSTPDQRGAVGVAIDQLSEVRKHAYTLGMGT